MSERGNGKLFKERNDQKCGSSDFNYDNENKSMAAQILLKTSKDGQWRW